MPLKTMGWISLNPGRASGQGRSLSVIVSPIFTSVADFTAAAVNLYVPVTIDGVSKGEWFAHAEVLERLRVIGVDFAQGYLIHRPGPIGSLIEIESRSTV